MDGFKREKFQTIIRKRKIKSDKRTLNSNLNEFKSQMYVCVYSSWCLFIFCTFLVCIISEFMVLNGIVYAEAYLKI